ncbi:hypothetical protein ANRL1_03961 [Anaerolineae bacterium]|nr:hypothetical protein ANRL1_03961 [Anaerolineae bacterium]
MTFKEDWTSDRLPLWLPHVKHLIGRENVNALEIGAFEGRSTVWMLEHILTHPSCVIVCVDPFRVNPKFGAQWTDYLPRFVENTTPYRDRIRILQAFSQDVTDETLLELSLNRFDLIYVDGSHETADVLRDAYLALHVSAPGAVIVFDDYAWDSERLAVDQWLKQVGNRVSVLMRGYQLIAKVNE